MKDPKMLFCFLTINKETVLRQEPSNISTFKYSDKNCDACHGHNEVWFVNQELATFARRKNHNTGYENPVILGATAISTSTIT